MQRGRGTAGLFFFEGPREHPAQRRRDEARDRAPAERRGEKISCSEAGAGITLSNVGTLKKEFLRSLSLTEVLFFLFLVFFFGGVPPELVPGYKKITNEIFQ